MKGLSYKKAKVHFNLGPFGAVRIKLYEVIKTPSYKKLIVHKLSTETHNKISELSL